MTNKESPGLSFSLAAILDLTSIIKGEAKFSGSRTEDQVRERLQQISSLKDLCNSLFIESNCQLRQRYNKDWVFLIEDFDKNSVSELVLETLFIKYSNIWPDLQTHLICTVPLWLAFGERGASPPFKRHSLVDIPVFDRDHKPYSAGRKILPGILQKRVDESLFADGAEEHLIQAAGGNIRDMFAVVTAAATFAELDSERRIARPHADRAVNSLRNEYRRRLGETTAQDAGSFDAKAEVLKKIYDGGTAPPVQDSILYRLLRSRVVHEYNDTYWYGLPPLTVDILIQQGKLDPGSPGGLEPAAP